MTCVLNVDKLSKQYRLGVHGHGMLFRDVQSWWARIRGKEDPNSPVGAYVTDRQKSNGKIWALKDVSLEVKEGEVVGIIGRNGAGKSTLLKIISRVTAPTKGEVKLKGRVASLLEVGTGFHPELTGRENIYLNGAILGMTVREIRGKFDEIVDFSGVEKFIDTPVKRYSSGMYVRLAFAVAAHLDCEILVVDEVLAVGDAEFQKKCVGKMEAVTKTGKTILFVSHNMNAIKRLCPTSVWLHGGSLLANGPSDELVTRYLHETDKAHTLSDIPALISSLPSDPAIKFIDVVIEQDGRQTHRVMNGKPIDLVIEYQILEESLGLRVYFLLCDTEGTALFRSFAHGDADQLPLMKPGRYISRATIPGDILAPVTYELVFSASIYNLRNCFPNGLVIPLVVEDSERLKYAYGHGPISLKFAPVISWKTETFPV